MHCRLRGCEQTVGRLAGGGGLDRWLGALQPRLDTPQTVSPRGARRRGWCAQPPLVYPGGRPWGSRVWILPISPPEMNIGTSCPNGYRLRSTRLGTGGDSRTGLAVAVTSVAAFLTSAFAGIDIAEVSFVEWLVIFVACTVTWIVWWATRLPRVMPGRIGFGLAIQYEDSDHAKQLRSDFVLALGDLITSHGNVFQFVELPVSVARRLLSADEAAHFARQCRLHFLLYGRARMRDLPNGTSHVIDLRGLRDPLILLCEPNRKQVLSR